MEEAPPPVARRRRLNRDRVTEWQCAGLAIPSSVVSATVAGSNPAPVSHRRDVRNKGCALPSCVSAGDPAPVPAHCQVRVRCACARAAARTSGPGPSLSRPRSARWPRRRPRRTPQDACAVCLWRACRHPRAKTLYPWHRALESEPGLLRRWSAPDATGEGVRFDIATVDVASRADTPGVLRTIVGMQSLVERMRDGAKAEADRLRARGWTKGDFANALGDLLDGRQPPLD